MSMTFDIDMTARLVIARGTDAVHLRDLRDGISYLTALEAVEFPRLVNFSDATVRMSAIQVREYVYFKQTHFKTHKAVRVASIATDAASFGLMRMYQSLVWQIEPDYYVFRTVQEGMHWLQYGFE